MSTQIRIESLRANRRPCGRRLNRRRLTAIPEPVYPLEGRWLLSQTFTVTDPINDGSTGSLDWTILQVNEDTSDSTAAPDEISFDIPGTGPFVMQAPSYSYGIGNPVVINGYSQPGSSPNTLAQGDNAAIQIVLEGNGSQPGLVVSGGYSTIEGLAINSSYTDVLLNVFNPPNPFNPEGYGGDTVAGNFLGTDVTGEHVVGTGFGYTGLEIDDVSNNTIGGTTPADRNIMSADAMELGYGVWVTGSGATQNLIEGNYIGTDAAGTQSLGNWQGISLYQSGAGNTIGGAQAGAGNLISASADAGIILNPGADDTLIQGNLIGTNSAGTAALPNDTSGDGAAGLAIYSGFNTFNTIGGTASGAGNLISGNDADGIDIIGSPGTLIEGNKIGTDITGKAPVPNVIGVFVSGGDGNSIGGTQAGAGNVISGNSSYGVALEFNAEGTLIQGNKIGTDVTGTKSLGNYQGVLLSARGNTLGGAQAGAGNVISGNTWGGVVVDQYGGDELIQGNLIGTDVTGMVAVPNGFLSYYYVGGVSLFGGGNTVGGTTPDAGNVISGNGSDGLDIISSNDNLVQGNLIGTGANGTEPLGNGAGGVSAFYGASYNTIGGLAAGAGNVIANNSRYGVNVGVDSSDGCPGNAIVSNSIYNNSPLGIALGFDGVTQNMPGGPFQGPNDLQNYPVLNEALTFPGHPTVITGTLNSSPEATFTLQFFDNPTADPSGYGQGRSLVGTITVTTDPFGNASFTAIFPVAVAAGDAISSTATDPTGNTSEFSADVTAFAGAAPLQALGDSYNTNENTTLSVPAPGVQANDFSADGGTITSILVSAPSHGAVKLNANGSFTYVPARGYVGMDSFDYEDKERGRVSNVATVTISVNPTTLVVTNTNDGGAGSLRQAMGIADESNGAGPDVILFAIPGTGPFEISPITPLVPLVHPTIIDGYSQPGTHTNSLATGDNAVIQIEIDGSNIGWADGIVVASDHNTIEGLSITHFDDAILVSDGGGNTITGDFLGVAPAGNQPSPNYVGVEIQTAGNMLGGTQPADRNVISANYLPGVLLDDGASGNLVQGNEIGTDLTGTIALGNGGGGVYLYDAPDNTIGGGAAGAGNVISANSADGILVSSSANGPGSVSTVIQGNLIGLDATGNVALGNTVNGVEIAYGAGTIIGGPRPGDRNVISGNAEYGIVLEGNASDITVEGNNIGTGTTAALALGNGSDGVHIQDNATNNTIGGSAANDGNTIANNGGTGVWVGDSAVLDPILTNSIFANSDQGIVLSGGGNDNQPTPVLTSAVSSHSSVTVQGTLTADPSTAYQIQFFLNPAADPSGYGQGQTYLATETVTTNTSGTVSFSFTIHAPAAPGEVASATATSLLGNTSAFSADVQVIRGSSSDAPPSMGVQADLAIGALNWVGNPNDSVLTDLALDQVRIGAKTRLGEKPAG